MVYHNFVHVFNIIVPGSVTLGPKPFITCFPVWEALCVRFWVGFHGCVFTFLEGSILGTRFPFYNFRSGGSILVLIRVDYSCVSHLLGFIGNVIGHHPFHVNVLTFLFASC